MRDYEEVYRQAIFESTAFNHVGIYFITFATTDQLIGTVFAEINDHTALLFSTVGACTDNRENDLLIIKQAFDEQVLDKYKSRLEDLFCRMEDIAKNPPGDEDIALEF